MNKKVRIILGLSFFYHDAAAALLVDGVPVAMAEEERFSRKKHDSGYPKQAIAFVLKEAGIRTNEIDYAVFYEKPFLKFERLIKTHLAVWPKAPLAFVRSIKGLFIDKLWIRNIIAEDLAIPTSRVLFSEHHFSHAASAFFASPYERAAILTIDGVGEWATTTIGVGEKNSAKIIKEIHFPHSIGLLYSAFTAFLGFEINEGEYKVMGMAPYGTPKYAEKVGELVHQFNDGSFKLNLEYFSFHTSADISYTKKFTDLFGKPRVPGSKFFTQESGWLSYFGERPENWKTLAAEQQYYADIAASIQKVTEEIIVGLANAAHWETGADALCYSGGVALNSVANGLLAKQTPFKKIFIQPAAGDSGGALGAALSVHLLFGGPRRFIMNHAYYGQSWNASEIEMFLKERNIVHEHFSDENALINTIADDLAHGKVVGWADGRFEWGPRALGARSILADPRSEDMKNLVNVKIKFREPYRPFAPSVLAEKADAFFELPQEENRLPALFMLYVVNVRKEKRKVIPAITHVDGTARPQLVFKETNPRYYRLIEAFEKKTGVPLVLNTSFNLKGEPIVSSPADAVSTFERSGLDVLVLGEYVVRK